MWYFNMHFRLLFSYVNCPSQLHRKLTFSQVANFHLVRVELRLER